MNIYFTFALIIILLLLDNIFTYKILTIYRKYNPEDENWADLEINDTGRLILKKYGLTKKSFVIQIITTAILTTTFFGLIYIFDFDIEFFVYATFGGLVVTNYIHYTYYKRLKNRSYPYNE